MDWTKFPPTEEDEARLKQYSNYRLLFKGNHNDVYKRIQDWLDKEVDSAVIYIVCNFAGMISKICADLLFGEPTQFVVGDKDTKEQQAVDNMVTDNNLHTKNYEMALSNSFRGDAAYKVRFGKPTDWKNEQVIVESVPARIFFPHLNSDNVQEMSGCTLAWLKTDKASGKKYLRKEIHEPGIIRNELWLMDGKKIKQQVALDTFEEYAELEESQDTKFPGLLVEHVPNWRLDDEFFGISDYIDLESLFDELNNRVSRVSRILDKHSDPKLILPPGSMKYDTARKRWYIEKESLQCFEVDGEVKDLPRYLVWDAQLEAAFKQIDKLLELLMMFSEMSPAAFGMDKEGVAESGRALKFRLFRTLAKINRKKLYFNQALKNILYTAQVIDNTWGPGSYEPKVPDIKWADGLPEDEQEQTEIHSRRYESGIESRETAVRQTQHIEREALEEEIERIEEDETKSNPFQTPPFSQNNDNENDGKGLMDS